MPVSIFLDSNVLLYTLDRAAEAKAMRARHWLDHLTSAAAGFANMQVMNEVTNVLLKRRKQMSAVSIFEMVDKLAYLGLSPIGPETCSRARDLHLRLAYSWWDCLLLASAIELGCSHFLSEDLQDGHVIGGLTVINPFLHAPDTLFGPVQD